MKFLVDENVRKSTVEWLRKQGYDTIFIAEDYQQLLDDKILEIAFREKRVLITNDSDFGDLIFHRRMSHRGVILFRLRSESKNLFLSLLKVLLDMYFKKIENSFIVISENQIRFR